MSILNYEGESAPLITVITVVYNAVKTLEETIVSVVNQTYPNIEYIIVDGASNDGSLAIAKKYKDKISRIISEPDKGIYDAMNKGVKASTGEWLFLLNADDCFFSHTTIEEAVPYLSNARHKIMYGNIIYIYPNEQEIFYGPPWEEIKYRFRNVAMSLAHQATFHARSLFEERLFDASFRIAGDYEFLLHHLKDHDAEHFPVTISKMKTGGLSFSVSKIALLRDTRKAQIKNNMYRYIPRIAWITSATKLLIVDFIIRSLGIEGKDKLKKFFGLRR